MNDLIVHDAAEQVVEVGNTVPGNVGRIASQNACPALAGRAELPVTVWTQCDKSRILRRGDD